MLWALIGLCCLSLVLAVSLLWVMVRSGKSTHQSQALADKLAESQAAMDKQLAVLSTNADRDGQWLRETFAELRDKQDSRERQQRQEIGEVWSGVTKTLAEQLSGIADRLAAQLKGQSELQEKGLNLNQVQLTKLTDKTGDELERQRKALEARLDVMRETMNKQLANLQESNEKKLEDMRVTVDEKLQGALEKRLGESFKVVSERLEQVHKGLGEMQKLAVGVGDLKKVMTNVKTRGVWGEVQLSALLEQVLAPSQYGANVQTKPGSRDSVEFAIKLPGREKGQHIWLPIDAKFPVEDYLRLRQAREDGDVDGAKKQTKRLIDRIKADATRIRDKYVAPPHTTDFAVMFLPTEGLYAEVASQPELLESLQHKLRIMVAGPSNLAAMVNSLQLGFRTLAIQQRSSEVWEVLSGIKTEFRKFGDVLNKLENKLQQAQRVISDARTRERAMYRSLRDVDELPLELESGDQQVLSLR